MIVRRMTDAIRTQDWVTVGVELLIVVFGILIAVEIDDWNEDRKNRSLEQRYLDRLQADMQGTLDDSVAFTTWNERVISDQQVILSALKSGSLAESDAAAFDRGLVFLGEINPPKRRWGTIEELKSSGTLGIIRDVKLRSQIAAVESEYERTAQIIEDLNQQLILLRPIVQPYFETVDFELALVPDVTVNHDFDAMTADPAVYNAISHIQRFSRTAVIFREGHLERIQGLRDSVDLLLENKK